MNLLFPCYSVRTNFFNAQDEGDVNALINLEHSKEEVSLKFTLKALHSLLESKRSRGGGGGVGRWRGGSVATPPRLP